MVVIVVIFLLVIGTLVMYFFFATNKWWYLGIHWALRREFWNLNLILAGEMTYFQWKNLDYASVWSTFFPERNRPHRRRVKNRKFRWKHYRSNTRWATQPAVASIKFWTIKMSLIEFLSTIILFARTNINNKYNKKCFWNEESKSPDRIRNASSLQFSVESARRAFRKPTKWWGSNTFLTGQNALPAHFIVTLVENSQVRSYVWKNCLCLWITCRCDIMPRHMWPKNRVFIPKRRQKFCPLVCIAQMTLQKWKKVSSWRPLSWWYRPCHFIKTVRSRKIPRSLPAKAGISASSLALLRNCMSISTTIILSYCSCPKIANLFHTKILFNRQHDTLERCHNYTRKITHFIWLENSIQNFIVSIFSFLRSENACRKESILPQCSFDHSKISLEISPNFQTTIRSLPRHLDLSDWHVTHWQVSNSEKSLKELPLEDLVTFKPINKDMSVSFLNKFFPMTSLSFTTCEESSARIRTKEYSQNFHPINWASSLLFGKDFQSR